MPWMAAETSNHCKLVMGLLHVSVFHKNIKNDLRNWDMSLKNNNKKKEFLLELPNSYL